MNMLLQHPAVTRPIELRVYAGRELADQLPRLTAHFAHREVASLTARQPDWLAVLQRGLRHVPYCVEAVEEGKTRGVLALAYVRSLLFGRFLVSLSYLNSGGVLADDDDVARRLIDRAADLADELNVRHLELRHEKPIEHPKLTATLSTKAHMRLPLPAVAEELWTKLPAKVRNQVRKGQKNELKVAWGGLDLLGEFYEVFSRNMRDLGTPVFGRRLFRSILERFPGEAEFCVVRAGAQPAAAALLLHGRKVTEVPSASSLRCYNSTCCNMLMYWNLLERAIQRQQAVFDFGRSTLDSNTFQFKKQWGAQPEAANWQYYVRRGNVGDVRPDNPRYQRFIRLWQRLPLGLTRLIGPLIVRGIP